jgi:glycosyltransferase involved in cell wall biosynthesis
MKFSIVVPLFNEAQNVQPLHEKIVQEMQKMGEKYEIIFVDDCSTDNTAEECKKVSPITLLLLRKNKGQTAALDAGIKEAQGEYIITMDGDLQNDPEDIPMMMDHLLKNDLDVVSGWRKKRYDSFSKRIISRGANFIRSFMIKDDIHDSGCALKIYKKECFETLDLYGEMHRFIPALLKIRGYRIGEVVVQHHPRKYGKTKYNWKRVVKGILDMFSVWFWQKYMNRPMHLIGGIGVLFFLLGTISLFFVMYQKIIHGVDLSDNAVTMMSLFFFFFGLNYILFGILFDLSSKIYYNDSKDRAYLIKKVIINTSKK